MVGRSTQVCNARDRCIYAVLLPVRNLDANCLDALMLADSLFVDVYDGSDKYINLKSEMARLRDFS